MVLFAPSENAVTTFLECGPFTARAGEGRVLYEDVSISLADGQGVCLEGASGSGKSTLLRQLTALAWAPEVARRLEGSSYSGTELPAWRAKVSLVAQDAPMLRGSVRENLAFPFSQRVGRDREFDQHKAKSLLDAVGLRDLPPDRDIKMLSGGERHRLALVRGLLWDPAVLVADEVLSGLDQDAADACMGLLREYAQKPGRLLICVLHDPETCGLADRRLRLLGGRLEQS